MKKTLNRAISLVLALGLLLSFSACTKKAEVPAEGLWEKATYLSDCELGSGEKVLKVEVKAGEESVTFTVNTDKETVGDALLEHKLIDGDEGDYGLYVKVVNGITADYDVDGSYWAFYVGEEYASTGVDATEIDESVTYKLEYTK